jgi:DNA-binding Lrp family transcriptional regulator
MKLDLKDKKILYELDNNSRQSFNEISKKVGLSKDAVQYRTENLKKEGIIKSFNAVIDVGKLGFISFRLLLKFYNASPQKEEEVISFLLKNKNLIWLVKVEGNWDINTCFLYKSIEEMNLLWNNLLNKYGNYIDKRELGIFSNVFYFNRDYFIDSKKRKEPLRFISLPGKSGLNKKDLKIIEILSNDARSQIVDIAEKTNLTPKTVINRIRSLEERKIILGYKTEFDLEKLGYKYYKIHISTFKTTKDKKDSLRNFIDKNRNVVFNDEVLGGYDLEVEMQVENGDEIRKFIEELRAKFSDIIRDYEVLEYYKEYRLRFFPS